MLGILPAAPGTLPAALGTLPAMLGTLPATPGTLPAMPGTLRRARKDPSPTLPCFAGEGAPAHPLRPLAPIGAEGEGRRPQP